ncbi:hypothetical protein J7E70_08040 [Variovorax paradoxus]|nr:hypothetical protein [Variovorax paradoxus]MBT2300414.1 hypothetical protein [Variovorax paradoxus]
MTPTNTPPASGAGLSDELIDIARAVEDLKRPCGMDPESPIAIQNGRCMTISYRLRALSASQLSSAQDGVRDEREAFEAWANDQGFLLGRVVRGDDYQDLRTQGPWEAWQARAALAGQSKSAAPAEPAAWQERTWCEEDERWGAWLQCREPDAATLTRQKNLGIKREYRALSVIATPAAVIQEAAQPQRDYKCGDAAIGVLEAIDHALRTYSPAEVLDENSPIRDTMRDVLNSVRPVYGDAKAAEKLFRDVQRVDEILADADRIKSVRERMEAELATPSQQAAEAPERTEAVAVICPRADGSRRAQVLRAGENLPLGTALFATPPVIPEAPAQTEAAWFHAECDDPDYSGFFQCQADALTQVNDHGGEVTALYEGPMPEMIDASPAPVQTHAGASEGADMFWDHDDGENFGHDIDDLIANLGLGLGDELRVDCAKRLPSICVRVIQDPEFEGSLSYELIPTPPLAQPGDDTQGEAS